MPENIESSSKLNIPPLEYLRECFSCDPNTGKVFWKDRPLSHFKLPRGKKRADNNIGKEAGNVFRHTHHPSPCGLKTSILYQGKPINVLMHHVVWRLCNGDIPAGHEIDHRNNNPLDNRLENLRPATHGQNMANMQDRKRELPRGVDKRGKKYIARSSVGKKRIWLGSFDSPEEAHAAFLEKSRELHGEFFKH